MAFGIGPGSHHEDMEAINRYFMQQATVKTPEAEKVKQEWMKWWNDNKRSVLDYTTEEFDTARNTKHRFDVANETTHAGKAAVVAQQARGLTSEEAMGETRRAGTAGQFLEEEKPLIPTSWKVGAAVGVGLVALGVFGKKLLALTPAGKLAKFLP
jgi:hypothetical protein